MAAILQESQSDFKIDFAGIFQNYDEYHDLEKENNSTFDVC